MGNKVVILGGGIAGLSAAHELAERGFDVEVYEALSIPGGKARSISAPGTATRGPRGLRKDLPGEHGFRFFPRFYSHVTDTMKRIPYEEGRSVFDNLVDTTRLQLACFGKAPVELISRCPRDMADVRALLNDIGEIYEGDLELSHDDIAFFASRVWQIITSCNERRLNEYEKIAWWEFIGAEERSQGYRKLLAHGITRSLVAAKAHRASTKTIGDILVQLLIDIAEPGPGTDRVLNGPTNEVWISPWVRYLASRGVRYHLDACVTGITCSEGRIQEVTVFMNKAACRVAGDYYVFALPIEDFVPLLTSALLAIAPALANLRELDRCTEWMSGLQIFLNEAVDLAHGHTIYVDSPWALTSISQAQFWRHVDLSEYGNGEVKGIISIDISEWDAQGLNGKSAKQCTPQEIMEEVWEQLKRSLNHGDTVVLKDEQIHAWFLDPSIRVQSDGSVVNEEPLLVNLVNTWALRPEAVTAVPNMFLASDYVRTYTDLATMEAANEAARRAVNGILQASGSKAAECQLWKLHEPEIFAPWRALDLVRYQRGLPWDDTMMLLGLSALDVAQEAVYALERSVETRGDVLGSLGAPPSAIKSVIYPLTGGQARGSSSELGRAVLALVRHIVWLAAVRAADMEKAASEIARSPLGPAVERDGKRSVHPRSGRVRIVSE